MGASTPVSLDSHYYFTTEDSTISEIISRIRPVLNNRIFIAFHISGHDTYDDGYYIYPGEDLFDNINLISIPDNFTITAYRGFIIASLYETEIWGVKDEKSFATKISIIKNNKSGWVLIPATKNNLIGNLNRYKNRIEQIWVQNSRNDFTKILNLESLSTENGYSAIWLKISEKISTS